MTNTIQNTRPYLIKHIETALGIQCHHWNWIGDGTDHYRFKLTPSYHMLITDNTSVDNTYVVCIFKTNELAEDELLSQYVVEDVSMQRLFDSVEQSLLTLHTRLSNECSDIQKLMELARQ